MVSCPTRRAAQRHGVSYSFLWMEAYGNQLAEIAALVDSGIIRPVIDRVFPFESTKEALAYVDPGRAKGKVVVKIDENAGPAARPRRPLAFMVAAAAGTEDPQDALCAQGSGLRPTSTRTSRALPLRDDGASSAWRRRER